MAGSFLEINNISKSFGAVQALKDISFTIEQGEIHALLGENGAGKSTLIKVIMGELVPDTGMISLEGEPFKEFSIIHSNERGIAIVHQELAVFENMTVAENIFPFNSFRTKSGAIDIKELNRQANASIGRFGIDVKATQDLDTLTLAQQQVVEILRAISLQHKVILLDEPTSGLNNEETEKLMEILRQLKSEGITIIYISHRIPEILEICDNVTVLRDGQYEGTLENNDELTDEILINKMVGREFSSSLYQVKDYKYDYSNSETIFEVKNLTKENSLRDVSFELGKGEVVGVYGLEGSGVHDLSRMIYGLQQFDHCEMYYKGEKITKITPNNMLKHKISYLNNNRKIAGLLMPMSAVDNISAPVLDDYSNVIGMLDQKALRNLTEEYINKFNIIIYSLDSPPKSLSGGNQQKLMLATALASKPDFIIINDPTRGIDVGAKEEIHKLLLQATEQGTTILLFSSELPELLRLSDRLLVMNKMQIRGELKAQEITEDSALTLATVG